MICFFLRWVGIKGEQCGRMDCCSLYLTCALHSKVILTCTALDSYSLSKWRKLFPQIVTRTVQTQRILSIKLMIATERKKESLSLWNLRVRRTEISKSQFQSTYLIRSSDHNLPQSHFIRNLSFSRSRMA